MLTSTNFSKIIDITAHRLAKAVGLYLQSSRAAAVVEELISMPNNNRSQDPSQFNIRARTARRWLANLGFEWKKVVKGIYVDGHERKDVVAYREDEFLPKFESI